MTTPSSPSHCSEKIDSLLAFLFQIINMFSPGAFRVEPDPEIFERQNLSDCYSHQHNLQTWWLVFSKKTTSSVFSGENSIPSFTAHVDKLSKVSCNGLCRSLALAPVTETTLSSTSCLSVQGDSRHASIFLT